MRGMRRTMVALLATAISLMLFAGACQAETVLLAEANGAVRGSAVTGDYIETCSGDYRYDLDDFGYRKVRTGGRGSLVFQESPGGAFMSEHSFRDGEYIYVNLYWRRDGYAIAYEDGDYGFVDARYIYWEEDDSDDSSDARDFNNFDYRIVDTDGRGNLVFQSSPRGSFMHKYTYRDGERIYVNVNYREDGYALAYEDGVFGYVDAKYIDWEDDDYDDDDEDDYDDDDEDYGAVDLPRSARDFNNYEYRTVDTDGQGDLVFQRSPGGSFMYRYRYGDGERIYVNVDYRKEGYAVAYEDGVYGYVDAGYIDW